MHHLDLENIQTAADFLNCQERKIGHRTAAKPEPTLFCIPSKREGAKSFGGSSWLLASYVFGVCGFGSDQLALWTAA